MNGSVEVSGSTPLTNPPYAYLRWHCSVCDSQPIEERNAELGSDLRCEHCGTLFRSNWATGHAEHVPDPEDVIDDEPEER